MSAGTIIPSLPRVVAPYNYGELIFTYIKGSISRNIPDDLINIIADYLETESSNSALFFINKIKALPWISSFFADSTSAIDLISKRCLSSGIVVSREATEETDKVSYFFKNEPQREYVVAASAITVGSELIVAKAAIEYFQSNEHFSPCCILSQTEAEDDSFDGEKFSNFNISLDVFLGHCKNLTSEGIQEIKRGLSQPHMYLLSE